MSTIKILDSDARPQPLSPLFTRLPPELRLMIYTFVFMGCHVKFGIKNPLGLFGQPKSLACRYEHFGGGFGLLRTCRMAYIEAFDTYWSEAVLSGSCLENFENFCSYLPPAIKANVRHIRRANLPRLGYGRRKVEDPYRVPAQFAEFPKLISCAFWSGDIPTIPLGAQYARGGYLLKVPDPELIAQGYEAVGPFQVKRGEAPAAYIERTIGVRQSDGVTILSYRSTLWPQGSPIDHRPRTQFFNWATGMVYQTSSDLGPFSSTAQEDAYQQALRARPGDEWSRSY